MNYLRMILLLLIPITVDASGSLSEYWVKATVDPNASLLHEIGGDVSHRKLEALADFVPLSCNTDPWDCMPWEFGNNTGAVEIPCNTCYSMGAYTKGETITINCPLNIKGKLDKYSIQRRVCGNGKYFFRIIIEWA